MIDSEKVEELCSKLDLVARLLAYQLVADRSLSQGAPILRRLGLSAKEIAAVFGTTVGTVRVGLSPSKRAKKKKAGK